MLPLNDPRWKSLEGGYRVAYDASSALVRLENGIDVWDELWQELHHQGDVGEASYASVPHLVRIATAADKRNNNFYALVTTIEIERHHSRNPQLPEWLSESYFASLKEFLVLALVDVARAESHPDLRIYLAAIAIAKGDLKAGALLGYADESELAELADEYLA